MRRYDSESTLPGNGRKSCKERIMTFKRIGTIHSPYKSTEHMPIQSTVAPDIRGSVELLPEYAPGLKDLDGFSHIILLYHFHRARKPRLLVVPFLDTEERGVFATRAPVRPNRIGLTVVRLIGVAGNILDVEGVDVLDGTPLIDIKPYVPMFDHREGARIGWLEKRAASAENRRSDDRFGKSQA
jgi:tRNA-Thr(GGU) m(6)t(6)A37 methyltransferase TsaA